MVIMLSATSILPNVAAANGNAANGKKIFNSSMIGKSPACHICHSLEPGKKIVGPSLAGIASDAAGDAKKAGMSTHDMLKQMITDPNAEIAEGFPANVMPQNFKTELKAKQLDDVVAFLMTLK